MCEHGLVPADACIPIAFRATARPGTSRWLRRRVRTFRYDALWADGRVDRDVDLVKLMYRRAPADYDVTKRAMHAECPEEGTGPWIAYPYGTRIDGPD